MANKKKYNPDDVERWVTVRGARIPIMKDGSFGVGTKDDDMNDEERAMDLVDSKDYIGDKEITRQVKDQLKDFGQASSVTVNSVEVSRWDGKSDRGYVEATYTLKGVEYGGRKTNQTFTEEFAVNVRKPQTTSRNAKYDTSRANTAKDNNAQGRKEAAVKHNDLMGSSYSNAKSNLAKMGKGELATIARKLGIPNSLIKSKDVDELRAQLLAIYKGSHK